MAHNEKTWWYEYDQTTGKSELVHITRGASQLDSILAAARLGSVNIAPLPVTERVRNGIKAVFSRK
jgi:Fe-S cluster assembly ATPase SufC